MLTFGLNLGAAISTCYWRKALSFGDSELKDGKFDNINGIMGLSLRKARELFEKEYLNSQINRFGGNISRTASFIGMERSALHRKLKSLNITFKDKTL